MKKGKYLKKRFSFLRFFSRLAMLTFCLLLVSACHLYGDSLIAVLKAEKPSNDRLPLIQNTDKANVTNAGTEDRTPNIDHLPLVEEQQEPNVTEAEINEEEVDLSALPKALVQLYKRNPDARDFVLGYLEPQEEQIIDLSDLVPCDSVPLLMQWDPRWGYTEFSGELAGLSACGPTCLSMAAIYLTQDASYTPRYIMDFAMERGYYSKGNGCTWTLISEGGEDLGLDVTELPLDKDRIDANLAVGNPVILVVGPGDFTTTGHFIVLTGLEDGAYTVNDPNSYRNSQRTWTYEEIEGQIDNIWALRNLADL